MNTTSAAPSFIEGCQFTFKCLSEWAELTPTVNEQVRHCPICNEFVFLCRNEAELRDHARRLHCVAFPKLQPAFDENWAVLGHPEVPDYTGPFFTLTLEPTFALTNSQLAFLSRAFDLQKSGPALRSEFCDGKSHSLQSRVHPDRAESLRSRMSEQGMKCQLSVEM
ncbi:MAG TPA: hypothetical protein PLB18_17290 [Acidobacteriota bacterium]|nr:hypothetical protein [Acidobacteriota bacterium]